jgi:integrase
VRDITRKSLNVGKRRLYSAAPEGRPMAKHTGIRKLPNGRFRARYFQGYDAKTGKRVYPARTFDTEREARDWRAGETIARGSNVVEGRGLTISAYMAHWLAAKLNLRSNTRESYETSINCYINPRLGDIKLSKLTGVHIEKWQTDLLKTLKPSTVVSARIVLHGALESATKKKLIRSNPMDATEGPSRKKPERYPLSVEEAIRLTRACHVSRFGLLFELMLACGLRPEEAIGLQWADLELTANRGVVRVRRVIHFPQGGGWSWEEPKTQSSERVIVFPAELAQKLTEHRKTQLEAKLKVGQFWRNNDLVFASPVGEPERRTTLWRHFKKVLEVAGLPMAITPYDLRHAFVTFSLMAGVDAKTASREAGHAKVSFTLDRYGHVLEEMHQAASDKREELLKSRSRK